MGNRLKVVTTQQYLEVFSADIGIAKMVKIRKVDGINYLDYLKESSKSRTQQLSRNSINLQVFYRSQRACSRNF